MNQNIEPPNAGVRIEFGTRWIQIHIVTHPHAACRAPSNSAMPVTKALTCLLKLMGIHLDNSRRLRFLSASTRLAPHRSGAIALPMQNTVAKQIEFNHIQVLPQHLYRVTSNVIFSGS
jgi:hypothetical protein